MNNQLGSGSFLVVDIEPWGEMPDMGEVSEKDTVTANLQQTHAIERLRARVPYLTAFIKLNTTTLMETA